MATPPVDDHRSDMPPINEQEFEDIMSRSRTVFSSAIASAELEAAAGEYSDAIITLVTAISIIKNTKVSNDDRSKILITMLQDTLRDVEDKCYSSGRRDRSRSPERHRRGGRRDRSRSPERHRRGGRRDRSRSRERHRRGGRRDRSRSRERHRRGGRRDRSTSRNRERSRERERNSV